MWKKTAFAWYYMNYRNEYHMVLLKGYGKAYNMQFEEIRSEEALQLNVDGKVDVTTANDFQNAVLKAFVKSNNVVINLENVPYMSSAGLRALVLGAKTAQAKEGSLVVINVQPVVMEVFKYSGMNKILEIR